MVSETKQIELPIPYFDVLITYKSKHNGSITSKKAFYSELSNHFCIIGYFYKYKNNTFTITDNEKLKIEEVIKWKYINK